MPGAPWPPTSLPSLPTTYVENEVTSGSTRSTPGTARTRSSVLAGMPRPGAAPSSPLLPTGRTTTSLTEPVMMLWKARSSVAVKTSEPATKATPSTMAKVLRRSRILRDHNDFHVARSTAQTSPRAAWRASNCFIRSRIRSALGSRISSTTRPSARKTIRSVPPAAAGSWVTMTMVWPSSSTL